LLLRRVVDANGRSRAYLNGSPVTVQQLREVAESLVDIHGQHAHQSLLRGEAQRALLDSHARLEPLLAEVAAAWRTGAQPGRCLITPAAASRPGGRA
jgi:DNA repair protein RecN (Recombination protein N)